MATGIVTDRQLKEISNAFREKTGINKNYAVAEYADTIRSLKTEFFKSDKVFTRNGTYEPASENLDGYGNVVVNVPSNGGSDLGNKYITENGRYFAVNDNLDGYNEVNVNVSFNTIDKNITQNGTYNAINEGYNGYKEINVNIPSATLIDKDFNQNGTYFASSYGADGFDEVNIQVNPNVTSKAINKNGTYFASVDGCDGYDIVTVNLPIGEKNITSNGEYFSNADNLEGYFKVNVNVKPDLYETTFNANGVYYPNGHDGFNKVVVNVPTTNYNFGTTNINTNGVYNANSFGFDGFSSVNVQVPEKTFNTENRYITSNGVYTPSAGYNGIYEVNVQVPEKTFNIENRYITSNGVYTPSAGFNGIFEVNVNVKPDLYETTFNANGVYYPNGHDGFSSVNVQVPEKIFNTENRYITSNGVYTPSAGYNGIYEVNVQVPEKTFNTENRYITSNGVYTPSAGYNGIFEVNVQVPEKTFNTENRYITSNGVYTPSAGFNGIFEVNVNVSPKVGDIEINANGNYFASSMNYDGFSKVSVNVPSSGLPDFSRQVAINNNGVLEKINNVDIKFSINDANFNSNFVIGSDIKDCSNMFVGCSNFNQNVTLPDHITNCYRMFEGCTNLSGDIYIDSSSILNTTNMFAYRNISKSLNIHTRKESMFDASDINSIVGDYINWEKTSYGLANTYYNLYILNIEKNISGDGLDYDKMIKAVRSYETVYNKPITEVYRSNSLPSIGMQVYNITYDGNAFDDNSDIFNFNTYTNGQVILFRTSDNKMSYYASSNDILLSRYGMKVNAFSNTKTNIEKTDIGTLYAYPGVSYKGLFNSYITPNFNSDVIIPGVVTDCSNMFENSSNFYGNVVIGDDVENCSWMFYNSTLSYPIVFGPNTTNYAFMFTEANIKADIDFRRVRKETFNNPNFSVKSMFGPSDDANFYGQGTFYTGNNMNGIIFSNICQSVYSRFNMGLEIGENVDRYNCSPMSNLNCPIVIKSNFGGNGYSSSAPNMLGSNFNSTITYDTDIVKTVFGSGSFNFNSYIYFTNNVKEINGLFGYGTPVFPYYNKNIYIPDSVEKISLLLGHTYYESFSIFIGNGIKDISQISSYYTYGNRSKNTCINIYFNSTQNIQNMYQLFDNLANINIFIYTNDVNFFYNYREELVYDFNNQYFENLNNGFRICVSNSGGGNLFVLNNFPSI